MPPSTHPRQGGLFAKLVEILVFGCAYSKGSLRRVLLGEHALRREGVMSGSTSGSDGEDPQGDLPRRLRPSHRPGRTGPSLAVDGCITPRPLQWWGESGKKPGGQGANEASNADKVVDASGIPLGTITAPARVVTTRRSVGGDPRHPAAAGRIAGSSKKRAHLDRANDSSATTRRDLAARWW
jgi:hypothetical protein